MLTLGNLNCQPLGVILVARHEGRHKRVRIMRLKVGGPIGYQGITSGVGLVETVIRKLF